MMQPRNSTGLSVSQTLQKPGKSADRGVGDKLRERFAALERATERNAFADALLGLSSEAQRLVDRLSLVGAHREASIELIKLSTTAIRLRRELLVGALLPEGAKTKIKEFTKSIGCEISLDTDVKTISS